jgi:DNA primase
MNNSKVGFAKLFNCIFHKDHTPSLRVWPNGQFYCHGCKKKGTVKNYSQIYSMMNYTEQLVLFAK